MASWSGFVALLHRLFFLLIFLFFLSMNVLRVKNDLKEVEKIIYIYIYTISSERCSNMAGIYTCRIETRH